MSKKQNVPAETPVDEHAGKGGSYIVSADGKRELVERTAPADEQPVKEQENGTSQA